MSKYLLLFKKDRLGDKYNEWLLEEKKRVSIKAFCGEICNSLVPIIVSDM